MELSSTKINFFFLTFQPQPSKIFPKKISYVLGNGTFLYFGKRRISQSLRISEFHKVYTKTSLLESIFKSLFKKRFFQGVL